MTLAEFKAWFSGFTESMDLTPNEKQWARIKERVGEIDGQPLTQTVFVDRYIERYPYRRYWYYQAQHFFNSAPIATSNVGASKLTANSYFAAVQSNNAYKSVDMSLKYHGDNGKEHYHEKFNGAAAMLDLGKLEYLAVA